MTTGSSIAVPKLKLGVRDAAKLEQGRARQASANNAELSGLREQVSTLERALETKQETDRATETKQETDRVNDRAAVEQVSTHPPRTSTPRPTFTLCTTIIIPSAPSAPSPSAISAPAGPHLPHTLYAPAA